MHRRQKVGIGDVGNFPSATYLLQAAVVVFSLLAGWFWMVSATGYSIQFRIGRPAHRIDPAHLPVFQTRWNARAAFCASFAAIAQALLFLSSR
jgi:hypothetical protein